MRQKQIKKMYSLKRKRAPGNLMLELRLVLKEIRRNEKSITLRVGPCPFNPKELSVPRK